MEIQIFDDYGPDYKDQMLWRWREFSKDMADGEKTAILGKFLSFMDYAFKGNEVYWWSREAIWFLKQHDPDISVMIMSDWNYTKDGIDPQMRNLFEIVAHPNLIVSGVHGS